MVAGGVWTTSVEAERTNLTSATTYYQDPQAGGGWKFLASGSNDVGSFNRPTSKAEWTVTVPRTGRYRFQSIGGTPGVPGRHALFVDGANPTIVQYTADLALTSYQRWQYRGSAEVTIPLTAGQHTLSLRASQNGTSVLPNSDITLDKFLLTDVTDGEPTVYPASTLRYAGGAEVSYDSVEGARLRRHRGIQATRRRLRPGVGDGLSRPEPRLPQHRRHQGRRLGERPLDRAVHHTPRGCLAVHRARPPHPGHQRGGDPLEGRHPAPAAEHDPASPRRTAPP